MYRQQLDRFDLEQDIMKCWEVVDDIKNLRQTNDRRTMTQDEVDNYLLGLETIYEIKFERLFETFETIVNNLGESDV
tara:strand:- start:1037 stop:1267 length:231 start_codon:yes stop_codon:yes gene_type:complete